MNVSRIVEITFNAVKIGLKWEKSVTFHEIKFYAIGDAIK